MKHYPLFIIVLIFLSSLTQVHSQESDVKRIAVYDFDKSQFQKNSTESLSAIFSELNDDKLREIPQYIVSYYTNDERFIVIDNSKFQLIKEEKERQKSEEFIDGYIVEQGKEEGFDYIIHTKYFKEDKSISVRVYDVATKTILCEAKEKVNKSFGMVKNLNETSAKLVQKINKSCFSIQYEVVRSLDKKTKDSVKKLLILAGTNQKIEKGFMFEILESRIEKVGEKTFERFFQVGIGDVVEVEDENFSIVQVRKGGKEIKALLDAEKKLYCKFLRN